MTETESIYSKSYQMFSKALTIKCNGFNEMTLGGNVLAKLKRWNVNSKFHRVLQPYDVFINKQKKTSIVVFAACTVQTVRRAWTYLQIKFVRNDFNLLRTVYNFRSAILLVYAVNALIFINTIVTAIIWWHCQFLHILSNCVVRWKLSKQHQLPIDRIYLG